MVWLKSKWGLKLTYFSKFATFNAIYSPLRWARNKMWGYLGDRKPSLTNFVFRLKFSDFTFRSYWMDGWMDLFSLSISYNILFLQLKDCTILQLYTIYTILLLCRKTSIIWCERVVKTASSLILQIFSSSSLTGPIETALLVSCMFSIAPGLITWVSVETMKGKVGGFLQLCYFWVR